MIQTRQQLNWKAWICVWLIFIHMLISKDTLFDNPTLIIFSYVIINSTLSIFSIFFIFFYLKKNVTVENSETFKYWFAPSLELCMRIALKLNFQFFIKLTLKFQKCNSTVQIFESRFYNKSKIRPDQTHNILLIELPHIIFEHYSEL